MQYARTITYLFILMIAAVGCKKDKAGGPKNYGDTDPSTLIGSWELRSDGGGLTGQTTHYYPGNGNRYVFTATTYQQFSQGNLTKSGEYDIIQDTSILSNQVKDMIVFDNDTFMRIMIKVADHKLYLAPDVFDGGGTMWERE